jgi:hypothetical protein
LRGIDRFLGVVILGRYGRELRGAGDPVGGLLLKREGLGFVVVPFCVGRMLVGIGLSVRPTVHQLLLFLQWVLVSKAAVEESKAENVVEEEAVEEELY